MRDTLLEDWLCLWLRSLVNAVCALTAHILQMLEEFLYPHTRVPLLKEGRGIVGTRGVSSTMPILVVFLHNIYKNRDTSIVQGTWSRVWIPYRLFLHT